MSARVPQYPGRRGAPWPDAGGALDLALREFGDAAWHDVPFGDVVDIIRLSDLPVLERVVADVEGNAMLLEAVDLRSHVYVRTAVRHYPVFSRYSGSSRHGVGLIQFSDVSLC